MCRACSVGIQTPNALVPLTHATHFICTQHVQTPSNTHTHTHRKRERGGGGRGEGGREGRGGRGGRETQREREVMW